MKLEILQENSEKIEELLVVLRQQLTQLRKHAVRKVMEEEERVVRLENDGLKQKVSFLKQKLISLETMNGVPQVSLPAHLKLKENQAKPTAQHSDQSKPTTQHSDQSQATTQHSDQSQATNPSPEVSIDEKPKNEEKKQKAKKSKSDKSEGPLPPTREVDVSMLDMRVGRVVGVQKHPDADSLYVEEVDVGEESRRTIVSGLVAHVPIEQMKDKLAVFLLNLKAVKMRGVVSQGMIMCASTPQKVEIIEVPEGVVVGERVVVDGYAGEPEEILNPKKKVWEGIQPDLRINTEGLASYKGRLWSVPGKGSFKAPSLKDTPIK